MGTCAPGSVRSRSATLHSLPAASASLNTAVSGQVAPGQTADGSTPACAYGGALRGEEGPHISRWRWCEQAGWVLRDQQPLLGAGTQAAAASSDKHTLAARRWGDGRDALAAAAATAACGGGAAAAAVARCAPAKRPRLLASTLTGDPSDAGFEAVGGLLRQKEALMAALALPLLHPRLFSALGASPARGVLLHGPPGQ
jgi:transitional endoplasmic reticulum ATPase